jgi:hypothetical protein
LDDYSLRQVERSVEQVSWLPVKTTTVLLTLLAEPAVLKFPWPVLQPALLQESAHIPHLPAIDIPPLYQNL